jgi:cobalt/nickel transport system permease protein
MHIPDGFIAPQFYLPAYGVSAAVWFWAARGLKERLDEDTIPRLAVVTALSYVIGMIMVPLPGGSTGHLVGVAMLAMLFGIRLTFLAYTLVLTLQALLFGAGGITSLPVNALAVGLVGAGVMTLFMRLRGGRYQLPILAFGAFLAVMMPALLIALVLGIQPAIAHREDGTPLFFPFGLEVALPAIVLPHLVIGVLEALFTLAVWRYAKARGWVA